MCYCMCVCVHALEFTARSQSWTVTVKTCHIVSLCCTCTLHICATFSLLLFVYSPAFPFLSWIVLTLFPLTSALLSLPHHWLSFATFSWQHFQFTFPFGMNCQVLHIHAAHLQCCHSRHKRVWDPFHVCFCCMPLFVACRFFYRYSCCIAPLLLFLLLLCAI